MQTEDIKPKLSSVKTRYIANNLIGNTVLDVGAGYGYYSEWLLSQFPTLTITAMDQLELVPHKGVNFLCANLEHPIPLPNNSFSTILAFDIIEHISNEECFVKELYRICQPHGVIIGSVPNDDDKFLPEYNLTFRHRNDLTHKRYYRPSTLHETLQNAGFKVINIDGKGEIQPQFFAEFFHPSLHFLVKKTIGLMRRIHLIDTKGLSSDLFFVAQKTDNQRR
jgi:2-polyprenyl-3-methyl-5-hydroxy-6-metoxy-1,4-benzoquinol methylase